MRQPSIPPSAHCFEGSILRGAVTLGENVGIWYNVVVRADLDEITVGEGSNIQENSVLHCDEGFPVHIGSHVTIGHLCMVHGCDVGDDTIVGMGSVLMDGAKVGKQCIIGAGSLLTQGTQIPDGMLAMGRPAKVIRPLTQEEKDQNHHTAQVYIQHMRESREADRHR